MIKNISSTFLIAALLTGCTGGTLGLLGLDKHDHPAEAYVTEGAYLDRVEEAIGIISRSVVPALDEHSREAARGDFELRTVAIGIALKGELGFGPFKAGISPGIRLAFGTGEKPPVP